MALYCKKKRRSSRECTGVGGAFEGEVNKAGAVAVVSTSGLFKIMLKGRLISGAPGNPDSRLHCVFFANTSNLA